jgi:hypothetical protein
MKEVEKAYVEMTSGYKDFIRDVVKASRLRQEIQKDTSSTKDPSHGISEILTSRIPPADHLPISVRLISNPSRRS